MKRVHLIPACLFLIISLSPWSSFASELLPETISAFEKYVEQQEKRIRSEIHSGRPFLMIDKDPEKLRAKAYERLQRGEILIDSGKRIDIPSGLIHHWTGVGFVPRMGLGKTLAFLQDYDHHALRYHPDVAASKLLSRDGDRFRIYLRFLKKKVMTVVLDTEHQVTYQHLDENHAASSASTTMISEVSGFGTPDERPLPSGKGWGFLWKLNTYWRFMETTEGVYIQCETISLTRDIPTAVGWIIGHFVNSIPRESLTFTLVRTRECLLSPEMAREK